MNVTLPGLAIIVCYANIIFPTAKQAPQANEFRMRGTDVSRLEGFTDAVIGFAITLVVVSLDVPNTLDELLQAMRGFVPFGLCFAYLVLIWYEHNLYFRRYGLNTLFVLWCNTALLFVILMYVYPLKFLANFLVDGFVGLNRAGPQDDVLSIPVLVAGQISTLLVVYGIGFVALRGIFMLLYAYAYTRRAALDLTAVECFDTRVSMQGQAIRIIGASLAIAAAWFGGPHGAMLSGILFFSLFPALAIHSAIMKRRRNRFAIAV